MFPGYTITIASGWTPNHEQQLTGSASDTLTVTKNGYAIKIYQAAFGGGICLYPGDPDQMGPNARYTSFVAFSGASGEQYRRGTTNTIPPMTSVCMNTSGTYGSITTFGHIDYTIPASPVATTLAQMDSMIATLKTQ